MTTLNHARRLIRIGAGFAVLLAGVLMLVLPGPGLLAIAFALALLAPEFAWARRLLDRMKAGAVQVKDRWDRGRAG